LVIHTTNGNAAELEHIVELQLLFRVEQGQQPELGFQAPLRHVLPNPIAAG
jgi:hypothetical protein